MPENSFYAKMFSYANPNTATRKMYGSIINPYIGKPKTEKKLVKESKLRKESSIESETKMKSRRGGSNKRKTKKNKTRSNKSKNKKE